MVYLFLPMGAVHATGHFTIVDGQLGGHFVTVLSVILYIVLEGDWS